MIKKFNLLIIALLISIASMAQDDIVGYWKTGSGLGIVQIYKTTSGSYAGKLVWLKEPIDPKTGKPKTDNLNPDDKLKTRPTLGIVNLWGLKWDADDKEYNSGKIYDPKNGKTYSSKAYFEGNNKDHLHCRGYIGISLIGRTDVWTRQSGIPK